MVKGALGTCSLCESPQAERRKRLRWERPRCPSSQSWREGAQGPPRGAAPCSQPSVPHAAGEQTASSAQQTVSREEEGQGRRLEGFLGRGLGQETSVREEWAEKELVQMSPPRPQVEDKGTAGGSLMSQRQCSQRSALESAPPSTLPGGLSSGHNRHGGRGVPLGAVAHRQEGVVLRLQGSWDSDSMVAAMQRALKRSAAQAALQPEGTAWTVAKCLSKNAVLAPWGPHAAKRLSKLMSSTVHLGQ